VTILAAQHVRERAVNERMIEPFFERSVAFGMSYGLSAAGYDIRIKQRRMLRPGEFTLASSIERFDLPADIIAQIADKSTWARRGIAVQNTLAEPGWSGYLTIEITNHGPNTVLIEAGSPIAQMVFHQLSAPTECPYGADSKYQNQPDEPVPAREEAAR
jgi:dCTP deaminase